MKKAFHGLLPIFAAALALASCSTTRVLKDGELRLARNEIVVVNENPDFSASSLSPYIRQRPNSSILGLHPFLYVYNWSDNQDKGIKGLFKKVGEAPVVYDPATVIISRKAMASKLEYWGWFHSKVDADTLVNGSNVTVRYKVTLGERFTIDDINFNLPDGGSFKEDFLADTSKVLLKKGGYLTEETLEDERARCLATMRDKGYYALDKTSFGFMADTIGRNGSTALEYRITEGKTPIRKVTFNKVSISYPEDLKIKESLIKGMNLIRPGETYSETNVANTNSRFSSLKVFNSVNVNMVQSSADSINCQLSLTRSKLKGFKTDLELSTNSSGLMGISPQVSFYHKNIFGGGEWLNIGFTGNFQFRLDDDVHSNEVGTSLSLSFPKFLGLSYERFKGPSVPRTEFNMSFNYQNRPEYTRSMLSTSYGYTGNIRNMFHYQVYPLQVSYVRLFDLNDTFSQRLDRNPFMKYTYQSHADIGLGGTVYYSTSSDVVPKSSYWTLRVNGDVSGNVVSLFSGLMQSNEAGEKLVFGAPFSQYARTQISIARGIRFGDNDEQTIAFRVLGGIGVAYGNSTVMPYEKQFYCGGSSSMRGWQARALGPGDSEMDKTFSIPSQTGDTKLEADIEYRFPIVWKLEGALFAEAGNVWERKSGVDLGDIAADYGYGLRVNLDFLLLRVDMGLKLRDPSRDQVWLTPADSFKKSGFTVHFGVGYPF